MTNPTHAYIGRCRGCNLTQAACIETIGNLARVGKSVAEMIECDLIVERVALAQAVTDFRPCACLHIVQEPLFQEASV